MPGIDSATLARSDIPAAKQTGAQPHPEPRLLAILSPPRSFSSVISTMIGQHPEMYGFPELHLIMGDTVADVLRRDRGTGKKNLGPPGLLRTLAELDGGAQTVENVLAAHNWLLARRHWSSKRVMDHVMSRAADLRPVRICVEKSPAASNHVRNLYRQDRFYPDALYLHITRHPLSSLVSMEDYAEQLKTLEGFKGRPSSVAFAYWALCQKNIITFIQAIRPERVFRIKGEDLLSDPERWLPRICRWAGVDDSEGSIEAMLHPEDSCYASVGPINAKYGNDFKFVHSPKLRQGRVREGNLREALAKPPLRDDLTEQQKVHLLALANFLGYE